MRTPARYVTVPQDTAPAASPITQPGIRHIPFRQPSSQSRHHHRHHRRDSIPTTLISQDAPSNRNRYENNPPIWPLSHPTRASDLRTDGQGEDIIDEFIHERESGNGAFDLYDYLMQQRDRGQEILPLSPDTLPKYGSASSQSDKDTSSSEQNVSRAEDALLSRRYEDLFAELGIISLGVRRVLDAQLELFRTVQEGNSGARNGGREGRRDGRNE